MNTHTYTIYIYPYEHLRKIVHLEIHDVGHQEYIIVDRTSPISKRIISRKCNTYVKSDI
jgi:hypothetical protein